MDSLVSKLKANEAARRNVLIDDLLSIEYAADYSAALNQMERDLSVIRNSPISRNRLGGFRSAKTATSSVLAYSDSRI